MDCLSYVRFFNASIRMLYIMENIDINDCTFTENTGYYVIPSFGPPNGYIMRLSSEIRGTKFHFVYMIKNRTGAYLEEAFVFQSVYAEAVCRVVEARFSDNDIIYAFSVLNPSSMPSKRVGLNSWGVTELGFLLMQYGVQKDLEGKIFIFFVDSDACRREFFNFKLQASLDWNMKTFKDLWAMVTWNVPSQVKYANILLLAEIG